MNAVLGSLLGALVLGVGGRAVMRLLTYYDGRDPGFSWGGSLEIILYGAIVGAVSGALYAAASRHLGVNRHILGAAWGLLTYIGTVATLPSHIADTAAPFAGIIVIVHVAFAAVFLVFGWLLTRYAAK